MSAATCAVWYWRHGAIYYKLCDDEAEAAGWAYGLQDSEEGAVAGIQYEDGSYVDRESWQALADLDEQFWQEIRDAPPPPPPPPKRTVRPPWDSSRTVDVLADAPEWLGS